MNRWLKARLLAFPFAIAGALNLLMWVSDRYHWHGALVSHYAFFFGLPWARLLGEIWVPNPRSHFLQALLGYALVFWIPAALYCGCVWIVLRVIQGWITLLHAGDRHDTPSKPAQP
jgi:hypothetical protein